MQVGYTGKLPAYGDFLQGGGSLQACKGWSAWAENGLAATRSVAGFHDIFLTSPIWRFAVGADVFGQTPVAGVLCPSMDKVGRLFPFGIMAELPVGVAPLAACSALGPWFDGLEASMLAALDPAATLEDLTHAISDPTPLQAGEFATPLSPTPSLSDLSVTAEGEPITASSDPLDLSEDEPDQCDGVWITLGGIDADSYGIMQNGAATAALFSRLVTGGDTHGL